MSKTVALYLRVSTSDQTIENQRLVLEDVACRHGWQIVATFQDEGISGAKGRDKRPGFNQLCQGITRRDFDMVAAWSVDRVGRSMQDLVAFLSELHAKSVDLYLHQQGLDTSTPAGRAMFQMLGVFAEFERALIVERVRAGIVRAKGEGVRFGRPSNLRAGVEAGVLAALGGGEGLVRVGRRFGLGTDTVRRLRDAALASGALSR